MGNTLMEVEGMRMSVEMDKVYGDSHIEQHACAHAQRALVTGVAEISDDDSYLAPGTTEG